MKYGSDGIFTINSGIGATLNGDVLNWLGLNNSNKIVESTYYQGDGFEAGTNYQTVLKESNGVTAKVGLIQVGDILASQSSTMLTKNYTVGSHYNNITNYWTMNKYTSTSKTWYVDLGGTVNNTTAGVSYGVRPVIKVRNNLNITGGNGTWKSPYQI